MPANIHSERLVGQEEPSKLKRGFEAAIEAVEGYRLERRILDTRHKRHINEP